MRAIFIIISCLLITSIQAQYFSGEITFKTTIIPKNGVELDTTVAKQDGQLSKYIITNGKYKNAYFEGDKESYSYTYNNKSKRMYDFRDGEEYITYRDSRRSNIKSESVQLYRDSVQMILGYPCFMVKRAKDYGIVKTYYSDSVKVDYQSFQEHAVGDWYNSLKQVDGCITIKSITEYEKYISVNEAIKITKREVEDAEFELPELPTVASYQALDKRVQLNTLTKSQISCYNQAIRKAAKIKGRTSDHTTYLRFVLTESDQIKFLSVYNPDEFGLDQIAMDILNECDLQFQAGRIGNSVVSSEVYFPVEFKL